MKFGNKMLKLHGTVLQGAGWKVVASFEGNFPNRIKQLPLDRHFDINNVKGVTMLAAFTSSLLGDYLVLLSGIMFCNLLFYACSIRLY